MIQPNRLSVPGEAAARQRVEVVFEAIDGIPTDRLHGVALSPREDRDRLVETLEGAVAAAGRGALLDEARDSVRNALSQRLAVVFPAGNAGLTLHATGRAADQVELVAAIDDAVAVAVAEDLLDPADARALSEPGRALLGLPPVGEEVAEPSPATRSRPPRLGADGLRLGGCRRARAPPAPPCCRASAACGSSSSA